MLVVPLPPSSPFTAVRLIFVLVRGDALSLRSRGCFSSQRPCWPEPRGAADCQLCHKSLHTLLLRWWRWPVRRRNVTKNLILTKIQMLSTAFLFFFNYYFFNPLSICWWCLHFFLFFTAFFEHAFKLHLPIMNQICPVFSEPHAAILNDALQGSLGFIIFFKLDDRNSAVSVFHFSFPAAMRKTRRTLGGKLGGQLPIFVLLTN